MSDTDPPVPGNWQLTWAVIFPAGVILFELLAAWCADVFFDPLPTPAHLLLVSLVPLVNFAMWRSVRSQEGGPRWLPIAAGAAIAISASYTLLFLPIMPFAIVGILVLGLGLLPFAPLMTLVFAVRWGVFLSAWQPRAGRKLFLGAFLGLLLLGIADLPATATHYALNLYRGDAASQSRAVSLLRTLGDKDVLLRLAYGDSARATGLISVAVSLGSDNLEQRDRSSEARELYFRSTGTPFNAVEAPGQQTLGARRRWVSGWDRDQGGESVGSRVEGLALANSRIDGSVATRDNLGYFEWTFEVRNDASAQQEARMTLVLPEGAAPARATLWVNGEPREASIAPRAAARAAYASIVSVQRDPLLVTTDGRQRLLVQAFPVLPGRTMKFRVGYAAPFSVAADGRRSLALPAILERNFGVADDLAHNIWIEGDGKLGGMLKGRLSDEELLGRRPRLSAERLTAPLISKGSVPALGKLAAIPVTQTVAPAAPVRPAALMIVLDGSKNNRSGGVALRDAIDAIPAGLPVGFWIAGDRPVELEPQPWSAAHRARLLEAIELTPFEGGQDNLAQLRAALASNASGTLLWIHGPQPIAFTRSKAELEQLLDRQPALPQLIRYQAVPGRAFTIQGTRWFETAREIIPSGNVAADLRAAVADASGSAPAWTTTRVRDGGGPGSQHLVRLWAADHIAANAGPNETARDADVDLARRLNLITFVSGAVVLETAKQYQENGLPVPSADDVPTVPEPGTWLLLAMLAVIAVWLFLRSRRQPALQAGFV
jgi:hypothetical protein